MKISIFVLVALVLGLNSSAQARQLIKYNQDPICETAPSAISALFQKVNSDQEDRNQIRVQLHMLSWCLTTEREATKSPSEKNALMSQIQEVENALDALLFQK